MKRTRTAKLTLVGSAAALALGVVACEVDDTGGDPGLDDPAVEDPALEDDGLDEDADDM